MKISVGEKVSVELGGLRFDVLRREVDEDGGTSIEVFGDVNGQAQQVLRFDCFRKDPHYHMPPSAPGQLRLDPAQVGDPLEWALAQTRDHLPEMLRKAGFEELSQTVDAEALRRGWERVKRAVETAPEPSQSFTHY
jgi:hypothetical protein